MKCNNLFGTWQYTAYNVTKGGATMTDTIHIVKDGDTLYSLARMYQVPVDAIAKANGIKNADNIQIGQRLIIPQLSRPNWYVVRYGDTLYTIARRFFTTVDNILKLNDLADPDAIFPGEIIRIR